MKRENKIKVCPVLSAKLHSQSKEEIPVIIRSKDNDNNKLNSLVFNMAGKIKYNLPLVSGIACSMTIEAIDKLAQDPSIEYISFDSKVFALLDVATASIKTNIPHDLGYTGEGITVAIIDTGVVPHSDLIRPKNRIVGFKDFVNGNSKPYDDNGHGTHVAGIIGSNGYASRGKYAGVAPEVNILAIKALDETGSGNTSDIVSAIQWVIETKNDYNTKVLNLSLGSPATNSCKSDPLCKAVEAAVRSGITVVVAAGNSGPSQMSILSPGNSRNVITVGAVDDNKTPELDDDSIAPFSSRGPTKEGIKKPDIVAPGVDIMSLSNKSSDGYLALSGTSMATPLVSGAIATLHNKNKNLTPSQVKYMLMNSCIDLKDKYENQGMGILNLEKLFNSSHEKTPVNPPINNNPPFSKAPNKSKLFGDNFIVLIIVLLLLTRKL